MNDFTHGEQAILIGHFSYFLLIVSMTMRRMAWLRAIAITAGLVNVYRAFFTQDAVSEFWESVFVAVNVIQLIITWYFENHYRFRDEKLHFAERIPPQINRRDIRHLLTYARLAQYETGAALTQENVSVKDLIYIAEGIVTIERDGKLITACGPGDYIGEISFLTGAPSSATAIAAKPLRTLVFDQGQLRTAIEHNAELRRVVEVALNQNLAIKLTRATESQKTLAQHSA